MVGVKKILLSSIGSKALMALTGILLVGFLLGHLAGNLLVFQGREAMNDYAEFLKSDPRLLWTIRSSLLLILLLHVATGVRLQMASRRARPVAYIKQATIEASFASRSMLLTGTLLLIYLLYHLAHFTIGLVHPGEFQLSEVIVIDGETVTRPDVYGMVVAGFQHDLNVILYVLGMLVMGLHLSHGIASLFQSLGIAHLRYTPLIQTGSLILAWVLILGFISIPLALRLGLGGRQ